MSRIGPIIRKLYREELKDPIRGAGAATTQKRGWKSRKAAAFKRALTSRRTVIWAVRIAVVLVVLVIIAEAVFQFNRLTAWRTITIARRADVDVQLQRRENLIPNLVGAVSRYASYEQGVFKYVSDARETLKAVRGSAASGTVVGGALENALSRLIALAEEYPDLKATQSIQDLIKAATGTEDEIARAKAEYNKACEIYNQYRTTFPGNVFGAIYRFERAAYIGLEEEVEVPVMDLNIAGPSEGAGLKQ
jgi:LemA protein